MKFIKLELHVHAFNNISLKPFSVSENIFGNVWPGTKKGVITSEEPGNVFNLHIHARVN